MEIYQHNLLSLSNCLNLEYRNFFFGVSNGNFSTRYPYNRLLFSLGSEGETIIFDAADTIEFKRGMWLLIPANHEAKHAHANSRHLSIHFSYSILRGIEILTCIDKLLYGKNEKLTQLVEAIIECPAPLRFISGIELLCREILHEVMAANRVNMEQFHLGFIKYAKLTEYLNQNCKFHITVSDMAKIMDMGRTKFRKEIFNRHRNLSPKIF